MTQDKKKGGELVKETGVRLKEGQYWRLRLSHEELRHAETKHKLQGLQKSLAERDTQIAALKTVIIRKECMASAEAVAQAKAEVLKEKKAIEKALGVSLENTIVDDHTFEVKQIVPETKP